MAAPEHGPLTGLHHVTAVTGEARANLSFYTRQLGMRLVKKTVNQDDTSAYHLFYADAEGNPGTDLTFFDWPNTRRRRHGPGTIGGTALRVRSEASLQWWAARLDESGARREEIVERAGRTTLRFHDPEEQTITLVNDGGEPGGLPWKRSPVPAAHAIRGLGPITLTEAAFDPTGSFLTSVLGFREAGGYTDRIGSGEQEAVADVTVFATGPGGTGAEVHVAVVEGMPRGLVGRGGVHHVAFRTPDDEHHAAWHRHLSSLGVGVTPVIDRFYFRSLYFREPGGVLFEIATDGPGFTADEPSETLGEHLALPPFLEPQRDRIEAGLVPLP
ncbi:ring-cleaving dioxygenase [soil metagenome]